MKAEYVIKFWFILDQFIHNNSEIEMASVDTDNRGTILLILRQSLHSQVQKT